MTNSEPRRPRNAALTREAILESARRAFVQQGYDGAGLREIAAGAGVTAMLVKRYFGSKEGLFAAVVDRTMESTVLQKPEVLQAPAPGRAMAEALLGITEAGGTPLDGFMLMLRSASSPEAAAIARSRLGVGHQATMTRALAGAFAPERAAIVLSLVAGFQAMRQMIELPALVEADREVLTRLLGDLFQRLLDGAALREGQETDGSTLPRI